MRHLAILIALTAAAVAFAGPAADEGWPRATILSGVSPTIDGRLAPGEWDAAVTLTGFTRHRSPDLITPQPVAKAAWSPEALLVAVQIPNPPGQKAHARATDFDGTVWADDCVELHLDRGHAHKQNYQFILNALGTKFDAYGGDPKFNAEWRGAAVNDPGQWSCEFAIPWSTVGPAPSAGQMDGFNLVINSSYLGGTLTLAPLKSSAHDTTSYLHLVYGKDLALSLLGLDANALKNVKAQALGSGKIELDYLLLGPDKKEVERESISLAPPQSAALPVQVPVVQGLPQPGHYTLQYRARGPQGLLLVRSVGFTIDLPVRVTGSAFIGEGVFELTINPSGNLFPPADTALHVTVTGPAGSIADQDVPLPANGPATVKFTRAQLPAGSVKVATLAKNTKTNLEYRTERTFDSPLQPVWAGTREGLTDKVPAPWTPLTVKSTPSPAVSCWGRVYRFARSLFPSQVTTRAAEVLQSPIALTGTVNGQPLKWSAEQARTTSAKPNLVALQGSANSALKLTGTTKVEYDGMVRVDLTLTPAQADTTIQNLTLEIPLKPANARYLYHFPGRWGSVANSAYLPKEGWSNSFRPFIWLGDEDRGFSWFCESDRNWFPLDNKTALVIERTPAATVLRCNLIAADLKVTQPLTYTFGFQATPVKQPDKTVWDYRITHHGNYGLEKQQAATGGRISYPAAGHIRKEQGTFECWYRPAVDSENDKPFDQRQYQGNRSIFTVNWSPGAGGSNAGLYWNGTSQGLVGWSRTDGIVTDNPHTQFAWKANEWHHIAMTWDPKVVRIYLDGKMISEDANNKFYGPPLDEATIEIGGDGSLATIDEVRILSVARPPVISDKPYTPDAETLLLDHFDNYRSPAGAQVVGGKPVGNADQWVKFTAAKFGLGPTWEPQLGRNRLDELAEQGVRTICFHEHWVPYQSYPHVTEENRPKLRSLVDGLHSRNLNLLLYMSRQFADNSPEWELYNADACSEPRPAPYTRLPAQRDYIACWNGPYKDFALYWLGKTMDEFGNDGWYLDGPEWPMQCANRHHGCGYVAPNGTVRPTYDIFGTRDFMQRLYVLTRSRKPQGQLNIHNSTVMTIPTLGWGTSTWSGEQIDAIKPPVKTLDILPMDSMRTEFMGRQWGVPAEFLVYDGAPYYSRDVLAYTLLHGVMIRPGSPDSMERASALWKVHDEFPFSHGEMLGYWMNADYVKIAGSPSGTLQSGPAAVHATVWQLPKKGSLLVVSNLTDNDQSAQLTLNLKKLNATKRTVRDALTGETLKHSNGQLTLEIPTWRYRVLRVE